tara:strand:- start:3489 stop:3779 length:291 start_codon:yes stop_codon:yes gene_type:complete
MVYKTMKKKERKNKTMKKKGGKGFFKTIKNLFTMKKSKKANKKKSDEDSPGYSIFKDSQNFSGDTGKILAEFTRKPTTKKMSNPLDNKKSRRVSKK